MLGKSDDELFPALVVDQLRAIKLKVIETGVSTREEVYLTICGEDRYYDLLVEPLKDTDNSIHGITCVAVNITERKQAELKNPGCIRNFSKPFSKKMNLWLYSMLGLPVHQWRWLFSILNFATFMPMKR